MNVMTPIDLAPEAAAHLQTRTVSLDIRELRAFASVARNGNFARAARELELSQPTVSHQVQRLEDAVGRSLLVRHGRGAALTAAGAALLERLDAVAHLLVAPLESDAPADSVAGTLCLGLPAELAPVLLPPLVAAARAAWPQLRLEIKEAPNASLEEWSLNRRVDVAILQDPPDFDSLVTEPVVSEALGLVVGARFRLAEDARPVALRALAGVPLILAGEQHWIRRRLANAAFQHGVRLLPILQIDSLASVKELVRSGAGCAVLPRVAVQDEIARGALVFRRIEQPALVCTHAVAVSRAAESAVTALGRLTRQVMTDLVRTGGWSGAAALLPGAPAAEPAGETSGWALSEGAAGSWQSRDEQPDAAWRIAAG